MTAQEYEYIQLRLSNKIKNKPYHGNKGQYYEEAILAAKSIIKEIYDGQQNK